MKLICAGLPKTGTKSIARALRILGYKVYDFDEQILYFMQEWLDLYRHDSVPDFYAMYKDVDAVISTPSFFYFEELMEAFPDAKVLLSVREENAWVKSYMGQFRVTTRSFFAKMRCLLPTSNNLLHILAYSSMECLGINPVTKDFNSSYICRKRYCWHNDRVKSVVPADKLLVYSVQQGWEPLCTFIGKKIPDQPFPHLNVTGEISSSFLIHTELGRKITREVRVLKMCFVAVLVVLIAVVLIYLLELF